MANYNTRLKIFPNGKVAQVMVCSSYIFGERSSSGVPHLVREKVADEVSSSATDSAARTMSRARSRVFDLIASNEWNYFITLTIDPQKIDSFSYSDVVYKLNIWLDNRVRRKGLVYVIVPELHKSDRIHFHGVINDVLPVVDSGYTDKRGHVIYHLPDWTYGFTTAIKVYSRTPIAVAKYITKYITKNKGKVGGRWYLHGGKMLEPTFEYLNTDYEAMPDDECYIFSPADIDCSFKIKTLI